jgi:hypothetical protein
MLIVIHQNFRFLRVSIQRNAFSGKRHHKQESSREKGGGVNPHKRELGSGVYLVFHFTPRGHNLQDCMNFKGLSLVLKHFHLTTIILFSVLMTPDPILHPIEDLVRLKLLHKEF